MTTMEIERAIANVKATLAVEGLKQTKAGELITVKYMRGEIESKQAINEIINLYCGGGKCET
jgi:hypothetical protein